MKNQDGLSPQIQTILTILEMILDDRRDEMSLGDEPMEKKDVPMGTARESVNHSASMHLHN